MSMQPIGSNSAALELRPPDPQDGAASAFGGMLNKAVAAVVEPQQAAAQALQQFARGADGELHDTMLSQERADISLKFMVSVRNRALEAYREIMRMGQ